MFFPFFVPHSMGLTPVYSCRVAVFPIQPTGRPCQSFGILVRHLILDFVFGPAICLTLGFGQQYFSYCGLITTIAVIYCSYLPETISIWKVQKALVDFLSCGYLFDPNVGAISLSRWSFSCFFVRDLVWVSAFTLHILRFLSCNALLLPCWSGRLSSQIF